MILANQDNYKACKACVSHQDYIVITHYDHQLVKDFGILWTDFESFQCFGMCGTAVQQQSKALFSNLTSGSLVWGRMLLKSLLHARPKPRKAKCCEFWSYHFRRTPLFENSNQLKPGLRFCFENICKTDCKNLHCFNLFHTVSIFLNLSKLPRFPLEQQVSAAGQPRPGKWLARAQA